MFGTKLENYYKDIIPLKGSRFFHDIELKKQTSCISTHSLSNEKEFEWTQLDFIKCNQPFQPDCCW